jgi:Sugar phosphate isomerases/epimerases
MLNVKISGFYDEYSGNFDEQLAEVKKLGEKYMCPRTIDGKNISDYTAAEFIEKVKPRLDASGVKFSSIGSPIGKVGVNDEEGFQKHLEKLKELIKICRAVDCKYIRIFSFFIDKDDKPERHASTVIRKLSAFLDAAKDTGVTLLHENEKHIYGDTDFRCLELYGALAEKGLRLVYDASNFIQVGVDPRKAYELLKDYIVYFHIKDCDAESKVEYPVGLGDGGYKELFKELDARGYDGFMTIEPHTFKYALMRKGVYFTPLAPLFMRNYYKAFKKLDRLLGKKAGDKVTRKEVFELQYNNLKTLLNEVNNG